MADFNVEQLLPRQAARLRQQQAHDPAMTDSNTRSPA
jgi:hypothetical protein